MVNNPGIQGQKSNKDLDTLQDASIADWVHHGLISVKFLPPTSGQQHYQDLASTHFQLQVAVHW